MTRSSVRPEARPIVESCIPVVPSADLEKSLRLCVDGLGRFVVGGCDVA